jgi:hypothetical protein
VARLVQLVLTDQIAELTAAALRDASNSEDVTVEEAGILYDSSLLFQTASESPERFPLTGARATSLKRQVTRAPHINGNSGNTAASTRNKRKIRQESRARWAKIRRKNRREMAEAYNEARATMEAEREEMEMAYAEQQAKLADEPKFDVFALDGSRLLGGIPESMIKPAEVTPEEKAAFEAESGIILP